MAETLLVHIEPQPDFPYVDLSEDNAAFLELTLANDTLLAQWHDGAEVSVPMFRTSHPVLRAASSRSLEGIDVDAVEHGLRLFEAMTVAVCSEPGEVNEAALCINATSMTVSRHNTELSKYFLRAKDAMQDELVRATSVVTSSAARFFPRTVDHAILGAAIARQFELDTIGQLHHSPDDF